MGDNCESGRRFSHFGKKRRDFGKKNQRGNGTAKRVGVRGLHSALFYTV